MIFRSLCRSPVMQGLAPIPHIHPMVLLFWSSLHWRHLSSFPFISSAHPHLLNANVKGSFSVNRCGRGLPRPSPPQVLMDLAGKMCPEPSHLSLSLCPGQGHHSSVSPRWLQSPFCSSLGTWFCPAPLPLPWNSSPCRSEGAFTDANQMAGLLTGI